MPIDKELPATTPPDPDATVPPPQNYQEILHARGAVVAQAAETVRDGQKGLISLPRPTPSIFPTQEFQGPEIPDELLEITSKTSPAFNFFLRVFLGRDSDKLEKVFNEKMTTNKTLSEIEKIICAILLHTTGHQESQISELFLDFYEELTKNSIDPKLAELYHRVTQAIWARMEESHFALFVERFMRMYELREIPRMRFIFNQISTDKFIPEIIKLSCEILLKYSEADHDSACRLFLKFHSQTKDKPEFEEQVHKMTRVMLRSLLSSITDRRKLGLDEDILYSRIDQVSQLNEITRHGDAPEIINLVSAHLKRPTLTEDQSKQLDSKMLTSILSILESLKREHKEVFSHDEYAAILHKEGITVSLLSGQYEKASGVLAEGADIASTVKIKVQMLKDAGDILLLQAYEKNTPQKDRIRATLRAIQIYQRAKDLTKELPNEDPYRIIMPIQNIRAVAILIRNTIGLKHTGQANPEIIQLLRPFIMEAIMDFILINSLDRKESRDIFSTAELSYYLGTIGHILDAVKTLNINFSEEENTAFREEWKEKFTFALDKQSRVKTRKKMMAEARASQLPALLTTSSEFDEIGEILIQFPLLRRVFLDLGLEFRTQFIRQETDINQAEAFLKTSGTSKTIDLLSPFEEPEEIRNTKEAKEETSPRNPTYLRPDGPSSFVIKRI